MVHLWLLYFTKATLEILHWSNSWTKETTQVLNLIYFDRKGFEHTHTFTLWLFCLTKHKLEKTHWISSSRKETTKLLLIISWKLILNEFSNEISQISALFAITLLQKHSTWKLILILFMKEQNHQKSRAQSAI